MRYLVAETTWKMTSLSRALSDSGTLITRCEDGEDLSEYHRIGEHDLVVLDAAVLRDHTALQHLRDAKPTTPICLVARNADPSQRAAWLLSGADAVLDEAEPLPEVVARIQAVARRAHGVAQPVLSCGPIALDLEARRVRRQDALLPLSPKLYEILEFLALRPGRLASREQLLTHVYGFENEPAPRVFDVYMCNLRAHLADIPHAPAIETVRGSGYRLNMNRAAGITGPLAA